MKTLLTHVTGELANLATTYAESPEAAAVPGAAAEGRLLVTALRGVTEQTVIQLLEELDNAVPRRPWSRLREYLPALVQIVDGPVEARSFGSPGQAVLTAIHPLLAALGAAAVRSRS